MKTLPTVILLVGAVSVALVVRLHGMDAALNHDEAYTWVMFASQSYSAIITSYSLPNNHILQSLMVHLAVQLFGQYEWVIRLPALLAGLLAVPIVFALGFFLFGGARVGLLAAWLLALTPVHISYSHAARGYSLMVLFSLLVLFCAGSATAGRPRWWVGFVASGLLGVWVIPSAVLHVAALGIWTMMLAIRRRHWRNLLQALLAGGALALSIGLVYWPIRTELVQAAGRWGVAVAGAPERLLAIVRDVAVLCAGGTQGLFPAMLAVAGLAVAARRHRPLALYVILTWSVPFLIGWGTGIAGQPRTYLFLLVSFVLLAAYGVVQLIPRPGLQVLAAVLLLSGYGWAAGRHLNQPVDRSFKEVGKYLIDAVRPGDAVVAPFILDTQIIYYAGQAIQQATVGVLDSGEIDRLLFVTKASDSRFTLDHYLLRTNLIADPDDYQQTLHFPAEVFRLFYLSGPLEVHQWMRRGQRLFSSEEKGWRILRLEGEGEVRLDRVASAWNADPGLRLENPEGIRLALKSFSTFVTPEEGLLLLPHARTEKERTVVSLYEAVTQEGHLKRIPLQMFRTNTSVEARGADGQRWYLETYLLPVQAHRRYGIYVQTQEVELQWLANLGCFFFPHAR